MNVMNLETRVRFPLFIAYKTNTSSPALPLKGEGRINIKLFASLHSAQNDDLYSSPDGEGRRGAVRHSEHSPHKLCFKNSSSQTYVNFCNNLS